MIWAEAIQKYRKFHPKEKNWKTNLLIFNTHINAINFWIVIIWLKYFKIFTLPSLEINLFPGHILNSFSAWVIEFALPFGIINYFLIFYKNRYIKIVEKYSNTKPAYLFIYSTSVIFGALFSAFLYGALN
jgi:hypothetical protein